MSSSMLVTCLLVGLPVAHRHGSLPDQRARCARVVRGQGCSDSKDNTKLTVAIPAVSQTA